MKYLVTIEDECLPRATAAKIEQILKDPKSGLEMMDGIVISVELYDKEK